MRVPVKSRVLQPSRRFRAHPESYGTGDCPLVYGIHEIEAKPGEFFPASIADPHIDAEVNGAGEKIKKDLPNITETVR